MTTRHLPALVIAICCAAACDRAAQPAVPVGGMVPGTPPGDLDQWVRDVQVGLDSVDVALASNRDGANRTALNLYTSRQEYMELYYGVGARMKPTEGLSRAVTVAETRFHELITLLGAAQPAEADIRRAISGVREQMEVVLTEAKHSPARLRATVAGKEQQ